MIFEAISQLLAAHCGPDVVRRIEVASQASDADARRAAWAPLWSALEDSGFVDALVSEEHGGSGLDLETVFAMAEASGAAALPLPLIHTVLARGVLAQAGLPLPTGAVTFADRAVSEAGRLRARVPFGRVADWVLVPEGAGGRFLCADQAEVEDCAGVGSVDADLVWQDAAGEYLALDCDWRRVGACASAGLLAGGLQHTLSLTLDYANTRSQFGKPIGKFQAVQQQLSVMAEEVSAAHMAASLAYRGLPAFQHEAGESAKCVAMAKALTSAAVVPVAGIAHAVHGAIGFTEEFSLQLWTRRLHGWRLAYGAEAFWQRVLGRALLADQSTNVLDFIRL